MPKIRSLLKNAEKCSIYIFTKARKKTRNLKVKNPTRPQNPEGSGPDRPKPENFRPVTSLLSGPLAAILKITQKCKQTAVSQKLSKIKKFLKIFFASHEVPKLLGQ